MVVVAESQHPAASIVRGNGAERSDDAGWAGGGGGGGGAAPARTAPPPPPPPPHAPDALAPHSNHSSVATPRTPVRRAPVRAPYRSLIATCRLTSARVRTLPPSCDEMAGA